MTKNALSLKPGVSYDSSFDFFCLGEGPGWHWTNFSMRYWQDGGKDSSPPLLSLSFAAVAIWGLESANRVSI